MAVILVCSTAVNGQKIMMLDNGLKENSKPIEVKRKGFSSIGKYEFGPYRIVSGKAGWTTTRSNKRFFSFETTSESKKKSSFVFVANGKDTLQVNTSTNTKLSETNIADWSWINQSNDNYVAVIATTSDTAVWRLMLVSISGEAVEGNFRAAGILTDGVKEIQIREIKQWNDGKSPALKLICGYEFFLDNNSIAAVQSSIDTFQKKFVWLHQTLDEPMKSVLAAAAAALFVYTEDKMSEMGG
jgi:hypothetical protein